MILWSDIIDLMSIKIWKGPKVIMQAYKDLDGQRLYERIYKHDENNGVPNFITTLHHEYSDNCDQL